MSHGLNKSISLIAIFFILALAIPFQNKAGAMITQIDPIIIMKENLQDRSSFTDTFETKNNEYIRFNLTTTSPSNSVVSLQIQDALESGIFLGDAQSFDLLLTPELNNSGTWRFWVSNPGALPGGDFIDVHIEIYENADKSQYDLDHTPPVNQTSVTTDSSDVTLTTLPDESMSSTTTDKSPNELTETVSFPYSLDLGDLGEINTTLRLMTGVQPSEIFGINGRTPIHITVSVGKFLSSANVLLDNLSFLSLLEGFYPVPFYTPFSNENLTLVSITPFKIVLVFNITYIAEFNVTKGNGILNQTSVVFNEPGNHNISLSFTGAPASGNKVEINVTWKAQITAQVVGYGLFSPIILKEKSPENVTGKVSTFEVEIDKKKVVPGFELIGLLGIPVIVLVRKIRRKKQF